MQAFRVVMHALRQLFGNLRQALMISILPIAIQALLMAAAIPITANVRGTQSGIGLFLLIVALGLASAFCIVWLAVRWHRFVLLNEQKNLLSPPPRAAMLRYVATAVVIFLAMFAVGLLLNLTVRVLTPSGGFMILAAIVVIWILTYGLTLILAVALPGAAIGAAQPVRTAWNAMKPAVGTAILLAVFGFLGSLFLKLTLGAADPGRLPVWGVLVLNLLGYWFSTLLTLSVLTTLWGHYVEGRPLR